MPISSFEICGFRGFGNSQRLELAQPTGNAGSGLTIIVGPNSGGKSTIIEGFKVISARRTQSFTEGRRNKDAGDRISIKITNSDGNNYELRTVDVGGSETHWANGQPQNLPQILVLPSRRYFNPYFGRGTQRREQYANTELPAQRGGEIGNFSNRLFQALENRAQFDEVLEKVMDPVPEWTIDQSDNGNYYLKFRNEGQFHNSDGLGEGLVSLFFIVDALYDSAEGELIVIDEPELSLHPYFQEKVSQLLNEYSATRQILYATHSPQFVTFDALAAGAKVSRVCKIDGHSNIFSLSQETSTRLAAFQNDRNNPHILGLDARKIFFLEDKVILLEGQEDIIFLKRALSQIGVDLSGDFYGWGVGGASNMPIIAAMLRDLGFKRVVGILDNNVGAVLQTLRRDFPQYRFLEIPASDIRTKPQRNAVDAVEGLLDAQGNIREHLRDQFVQTTNEANEYLANPAMT